MHRQSPGIELLKQKSNSCVDVFRSGGADRIADRTLIDTEVEECTSDIDDFLFSDRAFVWANEAGRNVASNRDSFLERPCNDGSEDIDGFLNTHIDVLAVECFRSSRKDGDAADAGLDRAFQSLHVRNQRGIADVPSKVEGVDDIL